MAGLVMGALLAELTARLAAPIPAEELLFGAPDASPVGLYTADDTLRLVPTPGFTGDIAALGYRVPIRIDSHGLRGGEPGNGRRWMAIGDSFTIAVQVTEADTFAGRVGAHAGVEVLNAGVDGYSTWQATRRYEALDRAVPVDTVLLTCFLGNDLLDNERYQPTQGPPPAGAGPAGSAPPSHTPVRLSTDPVTRFFFNHSVAFAWARVAGRRYRLDGADDFDTRRFRDELAIFTRGGAGRLAQLLPRTEQALRELRDLTRASGDRLLVAVAPPAFAIDPTRAAATLEAFGLADPDVDAPRRAVLRVLGDLGVTACDLQPALEASAARGEPPYLRFDGHWSVAGHAAAASAMVACLPPEG